MDSSSQLTIAYDMLYYVKFTAPSIKSISRPLPIIVLQISAVKGSVYLKNRKKIKKNFFISNSPP